MLVSANAIKNIDKLVDDYYRAMTYALIGDHLMSDEDKVKLEQAGLITGITPLMDVIYSLVRKQPQEGYGDATIQQLVDNARISTTPVVMSDVHQATLDNARMAFTDTIEATKAELKKQVRQKIADANKKSKQEASVNRYTTIPNAYQEKDDNLTALVAAIALVPSLIQAAFVRSFTTNLTDMVNEGVVDKITERSLLTGVAPGDVEVYKKVVNDGSLCQWCGRFYGIQEPKIYKLKELQANGSNYGKPKAQWKPTLNSTHPLCRCELHVRS